MKNIFDFITDFPYNFIEKTWKDDQHLIDHLRAKFTGFSKHDGYGSANAVVTFYNSLSKPNQQKLLCFIDDWSKR